MEVGTCHEGLCDSLSTDHTEARCSMGESGPTHLVDTFSSGADDLHTRGILQAIYTIDNPTTWSPNLYCFRQRSQVYGSNEYTLYSFYQHVFLIFLVVLLYK